MQLHLQMESQHAEIEGASFIKLCSCPYKYECLMLPVRF